jgi:sodium-dependent dicarboxylate transporter 2/3/5
MTAQIGICIAIFIFMMAMLAWNKYPMGVTALTAMALLVLFQCIKPADALASFGNSNAIIIVGMFVVGAGLRKTTLVTAISTFIRKVTGGNFKTAYRGVIILAVILTSLLTSPAVAFSIVFPIMDSVCDEFGVSRSKVHFPLCITCLACCAVLPFGFAISQAAVFNGLMETYGFTQHFTALDFTIGRLPVILLTVLWAFFLAPKFTPEQPIIPIIGSNKTAAEGKSLTKTQNIAGSLIFILTIAALIFNKQLGVAAWVIVLVGCLLNVLCGILSGPEAIRQMPMDICFMFIGANTMASALVNTGTSELIGEYITRILGKQPNVWFLSLIFFLVPFILTQFMQNQSVMNMFAPICLLTCSAIGADPRGMLVLICAGSLTAFMTPSATPGVPMMMAAGGYDMKSLPKMGWLFAVIVSVFYIVYVTLVMPAF